MRIYHGARDAAGGRVWVLAPQGVTRLAPRGVALQNAIDWGRPGPSAHELAWALIEDCTGDPQLADDWHACFSHTVVAHLPRRWFSLSAESILLVLEAIRRTERAPGTYPKVDRR